MKKSLLALAVLGAISASAFAQTNVTIYGVLDAGLTRETGGAAGSVTKLATGVKNGNRLGFKGTEDLGNGLKANFVLENGFNLDDGTLRQGGRLFGRQAFVGLSGGFGGVNLGRQYSPYFLAIDSIDPFGTGLAGQAPNLINPGQVRIDNAMQYSTPAMGGFYGNVLYALGEVAGNNSVGRAYALSAGYANGPIAGVLAYENTNNNVANVTTNTNKLFLLGGTYDFGVAKAHAAFGTQKNDIAQAAPFAGTDTRDWMLGVSAPVGAGTVMASFIKKQDRAALTALGAKQYGIGYSYAMSKRTSLYTAYAHVTNDAQATYFVGDASSGGSAPTAGNNSNAFNVGVQHRF